MSVAKEIFCSLLLYSNLFQILEEINISISKQYNKDLDYATSYFIIFVLYFFQLFFDSLLASRRFCDSRKKFLVLAGCMVLTDSINFAFSAFVISKASSPTFLVLHILFSSINLLLFVAGVVQESHRTFEPFGEVSPTKMIVGITFVHLAYFAPFVSGGFLADSWINGGYFDTLFLVTWNIQNIASAIISVHCSKDGRVRYVGIFLGFISSFVLVSAAISLLNTDDSAVKIFSIVLLIAYSIPACCSLLIECHDIQNVPLVLEDQEQDKGEENGEEDPKKAEQEARVACIRSNWWIALAIVLVTLVVMGMYVIARWEAMDGQLEIFLAIMIAISSFSMMCCACFLGWGTVALRLTSKQNPKEKVDSKGAVWTLFGVLLVACVVVSSIMLSSAKGALLDIWIATLCGLGLASCCTCLYGLVYLGMKCAGVYSE